MAQGPRATDVTPCARVTLRAKRSTPAPSAPKGAPLEQRTREELHVARPRERPLLSRAAQAAARPVLALLEKKHFVGARVPLHRRDTATGARVPLRRRDAGSDQRDPQPAPPADHHCDQRGDHREHEIEPNPIFREHGEKTRALAADMSGDLDQGLVLKYPDFRGRSIASYSERSTPPRLRHRRGAARPACHRRRISTVLRLSCTR